MRTRLALLLSAVTVATAAAPLALTSAPASACGSYGPPTHSFDVVVRSPQELAIGYRVSAKCGDQLIELDKYDGNRVHISGVHARECTVTVTALEYAPATRSVTKRVSLPTRRLVMKLPRRDW